MIEKRTVEAYVSDTQPGDGTKYRFTFIDDGEYFIVINRNSFNAPKMILKRDVRKDVIYHRDSGDDLYETGLHQCNACTTIECYNVAQRILYGDSIE